jgi:23S rRNA (cytosine1962-C5)-methyltransferase
MSLAPALEAAVASGHPWIYRDNLPVQRVPDGAIVKVVANGAHAYGVYAADGAIGVRLFGAAAPDGALIAQRTSEAILLRRTLVGSGTDAYRVVNGEGDFLPGIVLDRYGRYGILKSYAPGLQAVAEQVAADAGRALKLRGVAQRSVAGEDSDTARLQVVWGELPPPHLTVTENGLRFEVDVQHGQKGGAFLDQRENRALVRDVAAGARVLNLFAYTGGFSVYALAGGAASVVSVDIAKPALATIEHTLDLNDLDRAKHGSLVGDVFEYLPRAVKAAERYDLVIVDPPSLANNAEQRRRAQRAYLRLNRDALRLVEPGGLLATASCTAQVSPEAFRQVVAEAARAAGVRAQVVAERGHAVDHPVPLSFPEGRYLKFMLLRVL